MSLGPLMFDLDGLTLSKEEREMLLHPSAGGVILFTRNCVAREQLTELTRSIHALRTPSLLIAADQEGGRVQRLQAGFTRLPPCRRIGAEYARAPRPARALAENMGWLMAAELGLAGVDFSFAPVLDLDRGISAVIGDRAFAGEAEQVATLARHYMRGMGQAGMQAVGKHFPGHGAVQADSHHETPVDTRSLENIRGEDLRPFQRLIDAGLAAIMPAHVVFQRVDAQPAGFSSVWLQDILRTELSFQGAVFSDDLSMAGAAGAGPYAERARAALLAGCDMVLICNQRDETVTVLEHLADPAAAASQPRLARMRGRAVAPENEKRQRAIALAKVFGTSD